MKFNRLYEILAITTAQFRKGAAVTTTAPTKELPVEVTEVYAIPPASSVPEGMDKHDVHFIVVGVDKLSAEAHRAELVGIISGMAGFFGKGPSYIEVGAIIGDQGAALQLFGLGATLGFWKIITPETFGLEGAEAREAAGQGFIMVDGYHPAGDANASLERANAS